MKYFDVFGESGFHSAFMTSYAFSAQAFEDVPLPKLRAAGCRNIAVLADKAMLNLSFAAYGVPRYAGALYHLAKVSVGGAFHPKLTLLVGAKKGRLLIGSANLTALGLAGNKELVADVRYATADRDHGPLFGQAISYIERYIPADDPWFPAALIRAFRYAPWLRDVAKANTSTSSPGLRFLADARAQPVLDQIEAAIAGDEIERLVVLSPYWDDTLEGLSRLRAILGMPPTDVLIDTRAAQFPAAELDGTAGIELFDLIDENSTRFVHAKLIVAIGKKWDHVVSGSMNCSLPALLGPVLPKGNAEVGLYKRVERGTALRALNLGSYRQSPLDPSDIPQRVTTSDSQGDAQSIDGGSFELHGQQLRWMPPGRVSGRPSDVQLYDREGTEIGAQIPIGASERHIWELPVSDVRPRIAEVVLADGSRSVPAIIVDRDALLVRTLPPHRGNKRRIADLLDETTYEDLVLLQAIRELESLDLVEQQETETHPGTARHARDESEESPTTEVVSYSEFVQARSRARAEDRRRAVVLSRRQGGSVDLVSMCLNRLIGLVSKDLSTQDEDDLRRQADIDLRGTEPSSASEEEATTGAVADVAEAGKARRRDRATAKKILEAIAAFEERTGSLLGQRITTTELVRLRTLLQIVLAYAQPVGGRGKGRHVLPISGKSGDWPRLLGRLLNQHFKGGRALQALDVETHEAEQQRVLEYLAVARYAVHVAVTGAQAAAANDPVLKPLELLAKDIEAQVRAVIDRQADDIQFMGKINDRLNQRFTEKLGLPAVPRL